MAAVEGADNVSAQISPVIDTAAAASDGADMLLATAGGAADQGGGPWGPPVDRAAVERIRNTLVAQRDAATAIEQARLAAARTLSEIDEETISLLVATIF